MYVHKAELRKKCAIRALRGSCLPNEQLLRGYFRCLRKSVNGRSWAKFGAFLVSSGTKYAKNEEPPFRSYANLTMLMRQYILTARDPTIVSKFRGSMPTWQRLADKV